MGMKHCLLDVFAAQLNIPSRFVRLVGDHRAPLNQLLLVEWLNGLLDFPSSFNNVNGFFTSGAILSLSTETFP